MRALSRTCSLKVVSALAALCSVLATASGAWAQDAAPGDDSPSNPPPTELARQPFRHPSPSEPERTANNAIYVEGLGPGLLYSINYDRAFSNVALRLGFEYLSVSATNTDGSNTSTTLVGVPITVSYLGIGSRKHIFEVGAGATVLYVGGAMDTLGNKTTSSTVLAFGVATFGYRYQPPDGGFFLRAGISPLISSEGAFLPWPYLGLGATF
jgi:hypothetical protein